MKRTKLSDRQLPDYSRGEEIMNMVTHIVGGAVGVVALTLCVIFAALHANPWGVVTSAIYGSAMVTMFTISSVYHGLKPTLGKKVMQVLDHCTIYFLIAGTYTVILLVMVGVVFSKGPAGLLALLTPEKLDATFWLWVIIIYYFIATFVPIDKVIGKIYPIFGICLIIMAVGVAGVLLFSHEYQMPELWNNFYNQHPQNIHIWPFMFVTVACGAISGFHATQSPMMARCCTSEKQGHKVFYGAMVAEGIIAMVWAAAGVSFYENTQALLEAGAGVNAVVYEICTTTMGKIGGVLAMLGVIACPITSGDTAYRSARLTLADWFKIDQKDWKKRLLLTVPLLGVGAIICQIDYSVVWRYFSWSNQTLAMIALWAAAMYLAQNKRNYWICAVPATFMTGVSITYFFAAGECLGLLWKPMGIAESVYYPIAVVAGVIAAVGFLALFLKKSAKYKTSTLAQ